jgi:uncharacterized protein (UPF0335 family)
MANDVNPQASAQDWVNAMMYGAGAHPGQYGGGFGQSGMGALMGGLSMGGPALFGGGGTSAGLAGSIMLPGLIANMFAAPSTPLVGGATANLMGRSMMGLAAAGAFGNVQGGGGTLPGGFGLGQQATSGVASTMEGMTGTGPRDLGMGDVSRITQMAGQGGFFQSTTQVREVRARLKEMVSTVKSLSQELTMTIDEVSSGMNAMRGMGYNTAGSAGTALRQVMRSAAAAGMAPSEMMTYTAQQGEMLRQAGHMPLAMGAAAARNTLGFVGAGVRSGLVTEEALQNAYGATGAEGAMAMSNRVQELGLRMMNRAPMQFSMAAMMDPSTGKLSQERVNQMLSGSMSAGDIQRQASQYVNSLGPGGYAKWQGQMPEMRGQFMAAGGAMAPIALAGTLMGQHGYDMDPNDPRSRAAFGRTMSRMSGTRVDPMEARAMMEMYQNMGNIGEAQELSGMRQGAQERRASTIADRYAARDPVYAMRQYQERQLAPMTRRLEREAENMAARLERATSGASGMGFEVMVSAELYGGGRGTRALLSGRGSTADQRQSAMEFFRESSADTEGRQGIADIRSAIREAPRGHRGELRERLAQAESLSRGVESEGRFLTSEFMGSDRGLYGMSAGDRYAKYALDKSGGRRVRAELTDALKETSGVRESMLTGYGSASESAQRAISAIYNRSGTMSSSDLIGAVASGTDEQAARMAFIQSGSRDAGGMSAAMDLGNAYKKAATAAVSVRAVNGMAFGANEAIYGTTMAERYKTGGVEGLTRSAGAHLAAALGGSAGISRVVDFIQSDPERAGQLMQGLQSGATGSTLGALFRSSGVDVTGMDAGLLATKIENKDRLQQGLADVGAAEQGAMAEEMRRTGWSSDTQISKIQEVLKGKGVSKAARAFGNEMMGVGTALVGGDAKGAFEKQASALVTLARNKGMASAIESGLIATSGKSEARAFQKAMMSGGMSVEEFSGMFGEQSFKDIAASSGGKLTEEQLRSAGRSKDVAGLELIAARQMTAPGQGSPETAGRGASADLAAQFAKIMGSTTLTVQLDAKSLSALKTAGSPQEPAP